MLNICISCTWVVFRGLNRYLGSRIWRSKANVIIGNAVVFALCDNDYEPFDAVTRILTG